MIFRTMGILCMIHDNENVIHLSKLIECTPGVYPNVNCGLWVTMMCQCMVTLIFFFKYHSG